MRYELALNTVAAGKKDVRAKESGAAVMETAYGQEN